MDNSKKAEFVRVMGKKFLRLRKGGMVRHFDDGGTVLGGPGTSTQTGSGLIQNASNLLGMNASAANTQNGTNAAQLNSAYSGVQDSLNNQNNLTSTLMPQASSAVNNQNTLANQELAMASGQGPNPAAAQLAQSTGANVASQAALMAGQRGAAGNPGLMARQAAQTGAATQQNAAGQEATLEANQQVAAQSNLANLASNQINQTGSAVTAQNTAQQNEQNALQNANSAANNNAVSMQSNINNNNTQTNGNLFSAGTNLLSSASKLFAKGGEVGPNHPGPHKLDFVHKMTKMGLAHFDEGGNVPPPPAPPAPTSDVQDSMRKAFHFAQGTVDGPIPGIAAAPMQNWAGSYAAPAAVQAVQSTGPNPMAAKAPASSSSSSTKHPEELASGQKPTSPDATPAYDPYAKEADPNAKLASAQAIFNNNMAPLAPQASLSQPSGPANESYGAPGAAGTPLAAGNGNDVDKYFMARGGNVHAGPHQSHVANYLASGGKVGVPAMVSPKEVYLSPENVKRVIHEGADPLKIGHRFGGKAKVKGDSLKNDTIPVTLESGGVVIDRKNVMSREKAELFVHRALARKKAGGK